MSKNLQKLNKEVELVCPKCKSTKVGKTFREENTDDEPVYIENYTGERYTFDSDHYRMHYDCFTCMDCGMLDFPGETFERQFTEFICDEEGCEGERARVTMWDWWAGTIAFECCCCGKAHEGSVSKHGYFIENGDLEAIEQAKILDEKEDKRIDDWAKYMADNAF